MLLSALARAKALRTAVYDRLLRIDTDLEGRPPDTTANRDAMTKVVSLDYGLVHRYVRLLDLCAADVVFDVGCGPGRPLCVIARQTVRRCVGVEMSPEIADHARRNLATLKGRVSEAEVLTADAVSVDYDEGTVFWIYNSFGAKTLTAVLLRIQESVQRRPRGVRFCYINPEVGYVFERCGWLHLYRTVRPMLHRTGVATLWRN
jgi:SAM-dependent methyltransferase